MTSRSSSSGYSAAITGGQNFHARPGNETTTVTTAGAGGPSGIESFLGAMPDFTGHQKAGDIFARETFDQPDKYADEVQFLTGILDFFIVDQVRLSFLLTSSSLNHTNHTPSFVYTTGRLLVF